MQLFSLLAASPLLAVVFIAIISLMIGSFLNVVILRLPIMMFREWKRDTLEMDTTLPKHPALDNLDQPFNLLKPDSHCPKCGAKVRAWQNIPVISWLLLKGKCKSCGEPISVRYPIVELATAVLSAALIIQFPWGWPLAAMLVFTWLLLAMSVIDIDYQILPDTLTLGLLWIGLLVNSQGLFTDLSDAVYGAAAGYLALWSVYWIFKLLTGKEGMGFGDFKLLAALGAWLGISALPVIILLSSVVGAVVGIAGILILGRDKNVPIPFGPYLAAAGWIAAMWGDDLTRWYLGSL
ncbi:MAG: prepilin peptidase [Oceanospirillaceae bacterium]|uniref:prepilin peptidase n=1 Tax=unclassified Thalassolituus TaxID=2624967 RepID=UPI000C4F4D67|nr:MULTISPECIES: A24 family peptidase [unclassified Thalassolituus]MAS24996.1 prepilin peptidase [Oceanospirillaceae bacterium]MAX98154.1 prepilin peptidase [Oceanospirillaceae bacterium]MBL34283.1 prepilin peptidase [Oceanospirillaceae bacterium]MBS52765.1 prepilin peptidase [Oceanospirillaceae bacterium]MBS52894.1 prepilin peptidase [Oceanospirillaceae bacterium]|tara:strand:- start:373 stop:1251 length:879 start_codon:yes stop_codon:yes gene_type:complete